MVGVGCISGIYLKNFKEVFKDVELIADPDFYYQRGGGPLLDMGPYYITAMTNLLGSIRQVYGYSNTAHPTLLITAEPHVGEIIQVNIPTHYEAFLTLDSGINVSLLTSFDIYQSRQTNIEIYSTKGTLYVLEARAGIMKSAKTGVPYVMTSHFEREAPMDPTLPNGVL